MNRLGPWLAATLAILALGYTNALVEWGTHHAGWLLFVAFFLVCVFLAAGGPAIDLVLEHRTARREAVSRASSLPRPPRSHSTTDGSSRGSVHARRSTRPVDRTRVSRHLSGR